MKLGDSNWHKFQQSGVIQFEVTKDNGDSCVLRTDRVNNALKLSKVFDIFR